MFDVLGTVLFAAFAVILVVVLVPREGHGMTRARLAAGLSAWFVVAASLGAAGVFASRAP